MNRIFFVNPLRTYNKIKKYFKPLKGFFYCGRSYKTPLIFWNSKYFIWANDVVWKDKWDSPRFEGPPCFMINLFGFSIGYIWSFEDENDYWEQALWYLHYYNLNSQGRLDAPNIEKAKESWPWTDLETKKSTWNDKFLIH